VSAITTVSYCNNLHCTHYNFCRQWCLQLQEILRIRPEEYFRPIYKWICVITGNGVRVLLCIQSTI